MKAPPLSRKRKENNGPALSYGPWASMRRARKARPNKRSSRLRRTTSLETNQLTAELLAWRSTTNSGLIYLAVSLPRLQRGEKKISGDSDEALSPASGGRGHGHQLPPGGHHPQGNLPASTVLPLGSTDLPTILSTEFSKLPHPWPARLQPRPHVAADDAEPPRKPTRFATALLQKS